MNLNPFTKAVSTVLILFTIGVVGLCSSAQAVTSPSKSKQLGAEKGKANILFLFADDQMWESLGCLEGSEVKTPNLDRLREQGALFSHAYNMGSYTPAVCVASRTMLNTGAFVWNAAELSPKGNNSKDPNAPKDQAKYTVDSRSSDGYWSQWMKQAGYETYFAGKWHVSGSKAEKLFDHTLHVRGGMPGGAKKQYKRDFIPGEPDGWSYDESEGGFWLGGKHWSEVLADDGEIFLKQAAMSDKPFFMYLAFNAPHDPRQAPKEYLDMYDVDALKVPVNFLPEYPYNEAAGAGRGLRDERTAPFPRTEHSIKVTRQEYYALITHMDAQIGRILDALEASGKADNTYIFFTADHGLAVGDHGFLGKQNMYDSSMRVPFLMAGPSVPADSTVDAPIYLQDAMATSLAIAGLKKPKQVEFQNLLPLAEGKIKQSGYDAIYGAYFGAQRMYRNDKYKMIIYPTIQVVRLYDIVNDPYETKDLAEGKNRPVELMNTLFSEYQILQDEMGDPVDVSEAYEIFMSK
ncbi:sulfatase-like hydrolase/transferase [Rubritalea sp.]|uniref:sulfatase-like hydrolase/transferase n=1 Tax=Rubritalea sp. TaxID=2109375 RepID=UPI003EFAF044